MPFNFNPDIPKADCRRIKLGGVDYFVPRLALREILAVMPLGKPASDAISASIAEGVDFERFAPVIEIIRLGLKRGYAMTTDELLDQPITVAEMIAAVPVIFKQAGARDDEPGEAGATG